MAFAGTAIGQQKRFKILELLSWWVTTWLCKEYAVGMFRVLTPHPMHEEGPFLHGPTLWPLRPSTGGVRA